MKEPQFSQQADARREQPLKRPLPTTANPALINITEKGRKPKPRKKRDR